MWVRGFVVSIAFIPGNAVSASYFPANASDIEFYHQHDSIKAEQDMAEVVNASSNLMHLIKVGVKQLFGEVYTGTNNRTLTWYDRLGGLGNQLGGLSGALILGACTGRRVQLGNRNRDSVSRWLWKDYFEEPFPDWIARKDLFSQETFTHHDVPNKKVAEIIQSQELEVSSSIHHRTIEATLRADALAHEFIMDCLGRAAFRAKDNTLSASVNAEKNHSSLSSDKGLTLESMPSSRSVASKVQQSEVSEEARAGAQAVERFPQTLLKRMPTLVDVSCSALGAIRWKPKPLLQVEINRTVRKWGRTFNASTSMAIQVRACLDCKFLMATANVVQNVACDIALLERTGRLKPPLANYNSSGNSSIEYQSVYLHKNMGYVRTNVSVRAPSMNTDIVSVPNAGVQQMQPLVVKNFAAKKSHKDGAGFPEYSNTQLIRPRKHHERLAHRLLINRDPGLSNISWAAGRNTHRISPPKPKNLADEFQRIKQKGQVDKDTPWQKSEKKYRKKGFGQANKMSKAPPRASVGTSNKVPPALPRLSSIFLPLPVQPLPEKLKHIYVTTESDKAGLAIVRTLKALYPNLKIVSSVDDISAVTFTHSVYNRGIESRLKPVLDWYLLGLFDHIASCGTTFSQTAIGRRGIQPWSQVNHMHYPQNISQHVNYVYSKKWKSCRVFEKAGRRWLI